MYNELNEQMELGFDGNTIRKVVPRRRRRVARADWWFDQIRKMIDGDDTPPRAAAGAGAAGVSTHAYGEFSGVIRWKQPV